MTSNRRSKLALRYQGLTGGCCVVFLKQNNEDCQTYYYSVNAAICLDKDTVAFTIPLYGL